MSIFRKSNNSKPARAVEVCEVPLENRCEGAIVLLYALLLPQCEASLGLLEAVSTPVLAALRAETVRRWQGRGKPISIQLPERLPAPCIQIAAQVFGIILKSLPPCAAIPSDGNAPAVGNPQLADTIAIAKAILGVVENSRVKLDALAIA